MGMTSKRKTPRFEKDRVYEFERIKAKHLASYARTQLKKIRLDIRNTRQTAMITSGILGALLIGVIIIIGLNADDLIFAILAGIFGLCIVGIPWGMYSSKKGNLQRFYKKLGLFGLLTKRMAPNCQQFTARVSTMEGKSQELCYRSARSPYSRAMKHYYYNPWLFLDTNLKGPEIDGIKFRFDSFVKIKTKSGSVIREILTVKAKFFFKIPDDLLEKTHQSRQELIRFIGTAVNVPVLHRQVTVVFPENDVIKFKLKIIGPLKSFTPSMFPPIIQDFFDNINIAFEQLVGGRLLPLKESSLAKTQRTDKDRMFVRQDISDVKITSQAPTVPEFLTRSKQEQTQPTPVSTTTEELDDLEDIIETQEEDTPPTTTTAPTPPEENPVDAVVKDLGIYLGKPDVQETVDGWVYAFQPTFGDFSNVRFETSPQGYVTVFQVSSQIRKDFSFEIDVPRGIMQFLPGSPTPQTDLLSKYSIKDRLENAQSSGAIQSIRFETKQGKPVITILTVAKPKSLERALDFAKTLVWETKYLS